MGDNHIQFLAEEDGCVYVYEPTVGKWRKVCDVPELSQLPLSVKRQVRDIKDKAQMLPNV
jgi:hypothetical protein